MQARDHAQTTGEGFEDDGTPRLGELAAVGRDADEQRVGPGRRVEVGDDRNLRADAEQLAGKLSCLGAVEQRHHLIRTVAQEVDCGLRRGRVAVTLGEDDDSASSFRHSALPKNPSAA